MDEVLGTIGVAIVVFAATNVDDVFLLAAFFADERMRPRAVVAGQFLGIGLLVALSAAAALAALKVPDGYPALLGLVPLALGVRGLWGLMRSGKGREGTEDDAIQGAEQRAERRTRSQVLAVAAVTVANGGDNLAVYVPLFAREPGEIPLYAAAFAVMTALWCFAGLCLVRNSLAQRHIRRYGHVALPIVLIALGLWILNGALVLFA